MKKGRAMGALIAEYLFHQDLQPGRLFQCGFGRGPDSDPSSCEIDCSISDPGSGVPFSRVQPAHSTASISASKTIRFIHLPSKQKRAGTSELHPIC